MLPFALKVVWFCLSFSGIIACWVVQCMFGRAVGSYWAPILYSVFATLLEGMVCLGMIYNMDPYQMPKAFCITQTFVIYYSAWSLTGVCAAFAFATSSLILWPSSMKHSAALTLAWKNKYYVPIFIFPLVCLSISVPVLLRVNAIQPTENLYCDASHPEWGRFLGYAGFPLILGIPCFLFSVFAVQRIVRLHLNNQRTQYPFKHSTGRSHSKSQLNHGRIPTFERRGLVTLPGANVADRSDLTLSAALHRVSPSHETWEPFHLTEEEEFNPLRQMGAISSSTTHVIAPGPSLAPAIWRLILFQMSFLVIQCLAALSTVIDVARRRPTPTPFGSQHVALVLVGWGPAIVFGHLPAVRRQIAFWKRWFK